MIIERLWVLAFALPVCWGGCSRNHAPGSSHAQVAASADAAPQATETKHDVEVLWRMRIPSPFGATAVAIASDGIVGVIAAGKIDDHQASRFLGHSVRGDAGGTGIALLVVRNSDGVLWERRMQTDGVPGGLALVRSQLATGNADKSLYDEVGVSRPRRAGPTESVVVLAQRAEEDTIFVDTTASKSTTGYLLGASGSTVLTLTGRERLGRLTAWREGRPTWHLDADNAHIYWGEVVGDEIAVCLEFKGDALQLNTRASVEIDGLESDRGTVVLWLSQDDGRLLGHQVVRNEIDDTPCGSFSAVRAGAVVTERREGGKQIRFKLIPRDGTAARELLTVSHDMMEGLHVETDGNDQIVVVDQNFVPGAENPYPMTLTVIDTARNKIRWSGTPPEGVGDYSSVALRGDLLVYAGQRVGPMEIDGKMLPKPERDASDAGIVVALKLPPLP